MPSLREKYPGIVLGLVIILIALNILGGIYGYPVVHMIAIDLVVVGTLIYIYSMYQKYREEKSYYGTWGLFLVILALGILASIFTSNWVIGFVVVLAGIGGIILYNTFTGGK